MREIEQKITYRLINGIWKFSFFFPFKEKKIKSFLTKILERNVYLRQDREVNELSKNTPPKVFKNILILVFKFFIIIIHSTSLKIIYLLFTLIIIIF